jgi:hypothetical protein
LSEGNTDRLKGTRERKKAHVFGKDSLAGWLGCFAPQESDLLYYGIIAIHWSHGIPPPH